MKIEVCPSDLKLDRYVLGETEADQSAELARHLLDCSSCRTRLSARETAEDRLKQRYSSFEKLDLMMSRAGHSPRRAPVRFWALISGGLAAAAGLVLWWGGVGGETVLRTDQGFRTKGGLTLSYHVKRGDRVFEAGVDERLQPGDAIQFSVHAAGSGYLAILSLDGAKTATVYYPQASHAEAFTPGRHSLALSTVLDQTLGHERVWAVMCEQPFDVGILRTELEQRGADALVLDQCRTDELSFDKTAPEIIEPRTLELPSELQ